MSLLWQAIASLIVFAMAGCQASQMPTPVPARSTPAASAVKSASPSDFVTFRVGESVENRPIDAFRFAGRPGTPVLIFAGIHGDEPTTIAVARQLVDELKRRSTPDGPTVILIPIANPDGYERKRRANANGVDLNRNFPADNFRASSRGRYANGVTPLSEPESRALHDLVLREKPARILSIHSIRPPRHGNNFDGPAESLAKLLASHNRYAVLPTMGYATPGSFGSWAGVDLKIPTITLELPSNAPAERAWADNREAILAFIRGQ